MIRPAKHLDLNACVLRAAGRLLAFLQVQRVCRYDQLRSALSDWGDDAEPVFVPTVHLLFVLGRIGYHPQTDSFEYLGPASSGGGR